MTSRRPEQSTMPGAPGRHEDVHGKCWEYKDGLMKSLGADSYHNASYFFLWYQFPVLCGKVSCGTTTYILS